MNRARIRFGLILALLFVVAGFVTSQLLRNDAALSFPGARLIGPAIDWSRPEFTSFAWLGTNEILFRRDTNFFRLELDSARERPFIITESLPPFAEPSEARWVGRLSPDARNLLLTLYTGGRTGHSFLVRVADGHATPLGRTSAARAGWLPDSSGWIQTSRQDSNRSALVRHDLSGAVIETAALPVRERYFGFEAARDGWWLPKTEHSVPPAFDFDLERVRLTNGTLQSESLRLTLPNRSSWREISASPDGGRLLVAANHHLFLPQFKLSSDPPFFDVALREGINLWTTTADGRQAKLIFGFREMSSISFPQSASGNSPGWYPDGRGFCFRHGTNLWFQPVEMPGLAGK